MQYVKFCPKCANISWYAYGGLKKYIQAYENNICSDCQEQLLETEIPLEEYYSIIKYEKNKDGFMKIKDFDSFYEINRKILKEYIEPLGQLDKSLEAYSINMDIVYGDKDYANYIPPSIQASIRETMERMNLENRPKCPICGSTRLKKLDVITRGLSFAVFGFSSNKINKTYECLDCKATF